MKTLSAALVLTSLLVGCGAAPSIDTTAPAVPPGSFAQQYEALQAENTMLAEVIDEERIRNEYLAERVLSLTAQLQSVDNIESFPSTESAEFVEQDVDQTHSVVLASDSSDCEEECRHCKRRLGLLRKQYQELVSTKYKLSQAKGEVRQLYQQAADEQKYREKQRIREARALRRAYRTPNRRRWPKGTVIHQSNSERYLAGIHQSLSDLSLQQRYGPRRSTFMRDQQLDSIDQSLQDISRTMHWQQNFGPPR